MTINYEVTEKDYIDFNMYHMKNSKEFKVGKIILFGLLLLVFAFSLWRGLQNRPDEILGHTVFIITFIIFVVVPVLIVWLPFRPLAKWSVKLQLKGGRYNDFIGEQKMTLHDDYIEDANARIVSQIKYTTIEKICYNRDCFYIYIGAVKACLVPARYFSDKAEIKAFVALLKQKTGLDVVA